ncbi:MAG: TatD family hydrolase [Planctomyces sp.]|nr:TatD family hydrolase [Planctomyces sp.]
MLIDTHAHLDEDAFRGDLVPTLLRAREAGLVAVVTIGTTAASSRTAIELSEQYPEVYAAVGVHPNYAASASEADWRTIEELAAHPKVVGIGETGLDRYWDHTPIEVQVDWFRRHLELSRTTGKPFIVHCREAEPDVLAELDRAAEQGPLRGVMHSFCGSEDAARRCLAHGLWLSFAGMLTYKRSEALRRIAAWVPADRLLVETDAPYLAPAEHRGKRNEPAYVRFTARRLAEVRGATPAEIGEQTTANARELFRLPAAPLSA